ncbi:restriction endonuclease subunit S [Entomospira culicis]|uniref:Type I restriction modification DNA specificity domain-containing protein n=1 Tax=Entomospira culicis TaxID=2719989 RepID=A0A968KUR2_9SPIO|nr:restriction endonuclease subunit S [Entomospira culicis]NIZ19266.1 hypothetical protein [Entomospira culicis]NIZ69829.1 hypothetical protein [Entomospira culicis]WDI36936.1 restriction endonuclease subunit S [Entomospira culicis]WDI38565.1 restriction endonuclease subunit S [Entomospira culicis]
MINDREWEAFHLNTLFPLITRGKRLKTASHITGNTPYVSSTALNNGVDGFIGNADGIRIFSHCLSIANSGSVGKAFYHPYSFIASDHVTGLKNDNFNNFIYLFISVLLTRLQYKYSFYREINNTRINKEIILLPVTEDNKPDFEYMTQYTKSKKELMLSRYQKYLLTKLSNLSYKEIPALNEKAWKPLKVSELFQKIEATKGKTTDQLIEGDDVPYIAASKLNNGYVSMCSIKSNPNWVSRGNCILFVQIGDGAAGLAHYIPMNFIGMSGKTSCGYAHKLNSFNGVFIAKCLSVNKQKFSHGYSWTGNRLLSTKIMLPINNLGEPDFEYMEQYTKNMMLEKYNQYLKFSTKKN